MLEVLEERLKSLQEQGYVHEENPNIRDPISQDWIQKNLKMLGIQKECLGVATTILEMTDSIKIIWLHMEECSGCSESILRSSLPSFETLIFDVMRIEYHDILMAANGFGCKKTLEEVTQNSPYVLLVEGSISLGKEEFFVTLGHEAKSGAEEITELAKNALAIYAIGSCACYGGIQIAYPNPVNAYKLSDIIPDREIVHIAGCPPSDRNIAVSLMAFFLFGKIPECDSIGRPLWAYGKCLHDSCERKGAFLSGEFAQAFDDSLAIEGACLYKLGCRGPYAYNNCPKIKFNDKTSWPVQAGHGCIGCSEPNFWDNMAQFEEPMGNNIHHFPIPFVKPHLPPYRIVALQDRTNPLAWLCANPQYDESIGILLDSKHNSLLFALNKGEIQTFSNFALETNAKILLANLQNGPKQQLKLYSNYEKNFKSIVQDIEKQDSATQESLNLLTFFQTLTTLMGKEENLLELANAFHHPHESLYNLKFKCENGIWNIDTSKCILNFLAFMIGGLDSYGLAYGAIATFGESLAEMLSKTLQTEQKNRLILMGDIFKEGIMVEKTLKHFTQDNKEMILVV